MVELNSNNLKIKINPLGAELWHFIKNGKEYLWQGDPKYWRGRAYNLFPICGGLIDDTYFYNGKPYHLKKHGFAKTSMFNVEYEKTDEACFLLSSKENRNEGYPFSYEYRIIYKIVDDSLEVTYKFLNTDNKTIYFSAGAHEGYMLSDGFENYSIVFPNDTELSRYLVDGNIVTFNTEQIKLKNHELPLNYDYFDIDAIILKEHKSRTVYVKNNLTNEKIEVKFDDFPYLLIWTVRNGGYICIEPWAGLPDSTNSNQKLENKEGIIAVKEGQEKVLVHKISVL